MFPSCMSKQVFRPKGPEPFHFPRCGRPRTKWEGGTACSERPGTTVCRPWAMKAHSQNYPAGLKCPYPSMRKGLSEHVDAICIGILLGSIRPPRGRQSRNESQDLDHNTIAPTPNNSNTIYERRSLLSGLTRCQILY